MSSVIAIKMPHSIKLTMSLGHVNHAQPCFYQRQHFYLKNTSLHSLLAVTSLLLTTETFPRCLYYGQFARKPENTFCVNILCSLTQVFCALNYITTSLNNNFVPEKTVTHVSTCCLADS